ncbi:MAG: hypothetical protein ABSG45_09915 [Nitrososphaerales archaeon]|jgi:hypothetical protein
MALTDPLQWLVIPFVVLVIVVFVLYLLYRLLRVLDKAEKYFDAKTEEPKQGTAG